MNLLAIAVFLRFEESTDQNGRYLGNIPLDCSFHSNPDISSCGIHCFLFSQNSPCARGPFTLVVPSLLVLVHSSRLVGRPRANLS